VKDHHLNSELARQVADTLRFLAVDGVQKANSGHPGMPMGMADVASILWSRFLIHNPQDPAWINRDRFILSAGHGSMLLYSLLHLTGYAVTIEDLQNFRQLDSRTPGHPERGCLPGVEMTTGPLGQGFATGVGMAIAAKMTAARFNTPEFRLFGTHKIYAIISDGDLMEGISHEAASLAGHLQLDNLVYFYDDNQITIEGSTRLSFSESVAERFSAYGWDVLNTDGHNHAEIAEVLEKAQSVRHRPLLIIARTHIGFGSPHKQDNAECHGAPLGEDEVKATKRNRGWDENQKFYVPDEVRAFFAERRVELQGIYSEWNRRFQQWRVVNPELANQFDVWQKAEISEEVVRTLIVNAPADAAATRALSGKIMQKIADLVPGFCGGAADLAPSTNTFLKNYPAFSSENRQGRNFHFGIREHAMGCVLNGLALYGGFIPFGATFLVFADYMRPAIRLAALMELRVIYVFTHVSIFVGEDGPTHQPIEQVSALRAIPNLTVIRPADGLEVTAAWLAALRNHHGPTALILTRQKIEPAKRRVDFDYRDILRGGYVIDDAPTPIKLIIVASGSELSLAQRVKMQLAPQLDGIRVVSMPSLELFARQESEYQQSVISNGTPTVVIEAGRGLGWGDLVRAPLLKITIERFGASAPNEKLAEKFGFTTNQVVSRIEEWLKIII